MKASCGVQNLAWRTRLVPNSNIYNEVNSTLCATSHSTTPHYHSMIYCNRCDRSFKNSVALNQHQQNSSNHHICDDCDLDFLTWGDLREHYIQSPHHAYCQRCDEMFDDDTALISHYHEDHAYCESCKRIFKNDHGLHEHNRQLHHYCVPCRRVFRSESNLESVSPSLYLTWFSLIAVA